MPGAFPLFTSTKHCARNPSSSRYAREVNRHPRSLCARLVMSLSFVCTQSPFLCMVGVSPPRSACSCQPLRVSPVLAPVITLTTPLLWVGPTSRASSWLPPPLGLSATTPMTGERPGSPRFPNSPLDTMPRSQTPIERLHPRLYGCRRAAFHGHEICRPLLR